MTRKITMMLAAVLCLASCQDQYGRFDPQSAQGSVKFHLGMEGVESKAVYSGEVVGNVERIDWQAGDAIGIYCAQVKEDKYARYVVKSNGTADGGISKGEALPDGPELVWGEDVPHVFYSYFPEKAENGIATGMSGATVSAKLPATQAVKGSITNSVAAPDLKNMLMTAKSPVYTPVGGACEAVVSLDFVPLTTAVQFTITNQTKATMNVASVSLTSASGPLNGPFTVDIDDTSTEHQPKAITLGNKTISYSHTYPYCEYKGTVSDATRTVSIEFDTPVTLAYDADPAKSGKLTFTFFLQPCQNFEDLTFRVTKSDNSWMQTRLGYTDGSGLLFPRFMKSKVDGIFVPEGAQWTVKYGPDVDPWNPEGGNVDPMPEIVTDPVVTSWDTGIDEEMSLKSTCQVTYSLNGGSGTAPTDATKYKVGETALIKNPDGTPTKDVVYTFIRWNTEDNGSGMTYYPGDSIILTGNVTLYAQYGSTLNRGDQFNNAIGNAETVLFGNYNHYSDIVGEWTNGTDTSEGGKGSICIFKLNGDKDIYVLSREVISFGSDCHDMFNNKTKITEIVFRDNTIDTHNVEIYSHMFAGCTSLTFLDLSDFDTRAAISGSNDCGKIFENCSKLETISVGERWDLYTRPNSGDNAECFSGCTSLVGGNGTEYSGSHKGIDYARIDGQDGKPGYLTFLTATAM